MLVWCVLVVGLNDEIKKLACIGYLMISFPSVVSKSYQAKHDAKDGILVHSDWYHASKVHLLYLSIIW